MIKLFVFTSSSVFITEGRRSRIDAPHLSSSSCSLLLSCRVARPFQSSLSPQRLLRLPRLLLPFNLCSEICVYIFWAAMIMWLKKMELFSSQYLGAPVLTWYKFHSAEFEHILSFFVHGSVKGFNLSNFDIFNQLCKNSIFASS